MRNPIQLVHLMLTTILHHPRKLWLRKAFFQVHLWLGILLALYLFVISLSGAVLVFQDEIRYASMRCAPLNAAQIAPIATVIAHAHSSYPASRLTFVAPPQKPNPWWTLYLNDARGRTRLVYADAATGAPLAQQRRLFIDLVLELHIYLLAGQTGFIVNCTAGIGLLLLAITGAVLWWPGIRLWKRALTFSLRRSWKRVNYDLHSAIGFWTLFIVCWWGITAVYFLFPTQVSALVNAISPLVGMKPPQPPQPASGTTAVRIENILARQPAISPGYLTGIGLPEKPGGNVTLYIDRFTPGDFTHRDIDTFDGGTGKLLSVWHYGDNKSPGDWFLWLMYPLHFGTVWGLAVKILWVILGLSLSVLSVTGVLMYWNRYLHPRWRTAGGLRASLPTL